MVWISFYLFFRSHLLIFLNIFVTQIFKTTNGSASPEYFNCWARHFVKHLPSERPVLLILDGHNSRWCYSALQYWRENQVYVFCIASHTSSEFFPLIFFENNSIFSKFIFHVTNFMSLLVWSQPNDCGPNSSFKSAFGRAAESWTTLNAESRFSRHFVKCLDNLDC